MRWVSCGQGAGRYPGDLQCPHPHCGAAGDLARCGIGSGITADAVADAEWNEWRHKRAFVERASMPFDLLETLALEGAGCATLPTTWPACSRPPRISASPGTLVPCTSACRRWLTGIRKACGACACCWCCGQPRAEAFALQPTPEPVRLQLAGGPLMEAHSEFVRFKTTRRAHYAAFAPPRRGV